jgi:DNA-binding Lrp family transcriptional regulator
VKYDGELLHMIDDLDKKVISLIQGDIPLDHRPFFTMACQIGISEEEFLERVKGLVARGIIRRFGATLRHQEAGYNSNAMVAWLVPEERLEEVGKTFSAAREVTHCYHRRPQEDWPYNLFTMIHGNNRKACHEIAARMAESVHIKAYTLLFSEKEFKKTSMAYF